MPSTILFASYTEEKLLLNDFGGITKPHWFTLCEKAQQVTSSKKPVREDFIFYNLRKAAYKAYRCLTVKNLCHRYNKNETSFFTSVSVIAVAGKFWLMQLFYRGRYTKAHYSGTSFRMQKEGGKHHCQAYGENTG